MRPPRYPWEDWQMEYLWVHYGVSDTKDIAVELNRTPRSLRLKMCRLKRQHFENRIKPRNNSCETANP